MKNFIVFSIFLFNTLQLSGCSALGLGQANANLTQLYKDRNDKDIYIQSAAKQGLSALAKESATAADNASDPLNQIAFYRIAVTAAWQAGDYQNINQYANTGQDLCKKENLDNRDCLMLLVFPDFAALDETSLKINSLKSSCGQYSAECLTHYENAFANYSSALSRLTGNWQKIGNGSADPLFAPEVARRMGEATCAAHRGIVAPLLSWRDKASDTQKRIRGDLRELLSQQQAAKIVDAAPNSFDCRTEVERH
ncbi:MAG: hypothetical protein NVV73_02505 [Cellvibrionaceae bacterium]|nr:hypothetical protein [Cellvibrionaceae bacterium]